jgi:hypothetical protein
MALFARMGLVYQGEPTQKDELNSIQEKMKKADGARTLWWGINTDTTRFDS